MATMGEFSLLHVRDAQLVLEEAGIPSAVTGDVGLSYHGVDIAIFNVEICVSASLRPKACEALTARRMDYEPLLPDLLQPDYYHPYKKGASRFLMRALTSPLELHIVTDSALGLNLALPGTITTGLLQSTAHPELHDLCRGVDDAVLSAIGWASLGPFVNGWLSLAHNIRGSETEIIFLMEAERLIDANDVDLVWCEMHLDKEICYEAACELMRGKQRRLLGSYWG